uniref:Longitudinals lacking protein, isoforms A/B/D/L n=1 Tax=Cacopsylla melanoneura TaxID=428564 RepID=A0A8D9DVT2_9HEMI
MFSGHSILGPDSDESPGGMTEDGAAQNRFSGIFPVQRSGYGGYTCSMCKKLYKTRKTLQVHMRFQCGKDPQFRCPLCPKQAFQKVHIEMHVWGTHKMIGWKYWNKNQPKDENNRPHAAPEPAAETKSAAEPESAAETESAAVPIATVKKEQEDVPNDVENDGSNAAAAVTVKVEEEEEMGFHVKREKIESETRTYHRSREKRVKKTETENETSRMKSVFNRRYNKRTTL